MADVVNYYVERMLPELEDLERRGLFTRSEIKEIVERRRDFEYKIRRQAKVKDDFLRYIEFEQQLEALRVIRKKVLVNGMKAAGEKWKISVSDSASISRICSIYHRALTKFKGDLSLWLKYLEYCKKHSKIRMQRVLAKALQLHSHVASLWTYAAAWEFGHNHNVTAARALMQRGLRMCPRSEDLWLEYLRMELTYAQILKARQLVLGVDAGPKGDLTESLTRVIYENAVAAVPSSARLRQRFIEVLSQFQLEQSSLQDDICESIRKDFPADEQCWDWRARRCFESTQDWKLAAKVYEEALCSASSATMFELYARFLEGLLDQEPDQTDEIRTYLSRLYDVGKAKYPSVGIVEGHIRLLCREGSLDEAKAVAIKFCNGPLCGSVKLWALRLSFEMQDAGAQQEDVLKVFKQALKKVKASESQELWSMGLEYFCRRDSQLEDLLQLLELTLAGQDGGQAAARVAACAVDWGLHSHGIHKARQIYNRFLSLPGPSPELFLHCITLEAARAAVGDTEALACMRKTFDAAVSLYGKCNPELWLEYCAQERKVGSVDGAAKVYFRAKKTLADASSFVQRHQEMFP